MVASEQEDSALSDRVFATDAGCNSLPSESRDIFWGISDERPRHIDDI